MRSSITRPAHWYHHGYHLSQTAAATSWWSRGGGAGANEQLVWLRRCLQAYSQLGPDTAACRLCGRFWSRWGRSSPPAGTPSSSSFLWSRCTDTDTSTRLQRSAHAHPPPPGSPPSPVPSAAAGLEPGPPSPDPAATSEASPPWTCVCVCTPSLMRPTSWRT